MNKKRQKGLKIDFYEQYGRWPRKTIPLKDGNYIPSEWRRLKKIYKEWRQRGRVV